MELRNCEKCGAKVTWNGSNIECPFQDSNTFSKDWNCGVVSRIRDLCEIAMNGDVYGLQYQFCNDQKYVTIRTSEIEVDGEYSLGLCLWVTWYKSRGGTDAMWILDDYNTPRLPTYKDLEIIADYYERYIE